MYWCLQNITHQINDGDFWEEAIGLLQKLTEHKFYSEIEKFSSQFFPSDTDELWSFNSFCVDQGHKLFSITGWIESKLKDLKIHNAQHHRKHPLGDV